MFYTCVVFFVFFLIARIGAGVTAYMLEGDFDARVNGNMIEGMHSYGKEGFGGVTDTWDIVQKNLNCCGVQHKNDWNQQNNVTLSAGTTPDSWCEGGQVDDCGKDAHITKYSLGCYQLFREQFEDNFAVIKVQVVTSKKDETAKAVTKDLKDNSILLRRHSMLRLSSSILLSTLLSKWKKSRWKTGRTKSWRSLRRGLSTGLCWMDT